MRVLLVKLLRDTSGASTMDYSLVAAAVSLAIIVILTAVGADFSNPIQALTAAFGGDVSHP